MYTEAIELCPDSAGYYGNRAACYMMLGRYKDAFDDARKSIQLDDQYLKGYIRVLKCSLALGDIATAEQSINNIKQLSMNANTNNDDTNNTVLQSIDNEIKSLNIIKLYTDEAQKAYEKSDYRKVVYCMDRLLEQCPACVKYKLMKAECLAYLTRYQEAQEIANDILHIDKSNADAIYVRGMCLFYEDNIDRAFSHFQHVLRLAPDHTKAMNIYKRAKLLKQKKDEGNQAFKNNKFDEAYALYTEALKIDQFNAITNAKLYFNRAIVLSRLNKLPEAIADCNEALKLDENYLKALLRRAKCYMDSQDYESAVRDYEKACKLDKSRENKRLLQDAKLALKKSKRKDYYKILGIDKNASEDDIKKAYRKRALVHHPDRHANASENERKEQERKFKELGEAYGILSDPKKKARYDNGHDIDDLDGGMHGMYYYKFLFKLLAFGRFAR